MSVENRKIGVIEMPSMLHPTGAHPVDDRITVEKVTDLTNVLYWQKRDLRLAPDSTMPNQLYDGLLVSVNEDGSVWEFLGDGANWDDIASPDKWARAIGPLKQGGGSANIVGSDTVKVVITSGNTGNTITLSSPELEFSGDTYVSASTVENHKLVLKSNVIDTLKGFSALTETGSLVDAKVLKDVILEDEEVTAAAFNDLNDRLIDLSGKTKTMVAFNTIVTKEGTLDAFTDQTVILDTDSTIAVEVEDNKISLSAGFSLVKKTTGLEANVKEEYILQDAAGNAKGAPVKIYKDSALSKVEAGHSGGTINPQTGEVTDGDEGNITVLRIVYVADNGEFSMAEIDISSMITESEFADGLKVEGKTVSVKIDDASEPYLTVSEDGLKLSGLTSILNGIKAYAKVTIGGKTHTAMSSAATISFSGDTYVGMKFRNGVSGDPVIDLKSNVIDTIEDFSGLTETGSLVDAKVLKDVILEDEEAIAAALNDLNDRILDMDCADEAIENAYVSKVSQENGKISVEHKSLNDGVWGQMLNEYNFNQAVAYVSSLNPIDCSAHLVVATVSGNDALNIALNEEWNEKLPVRETHILIHNLSNAVVTISITVGSKVVAISGNNFAIPANGWGEANIIVNGDMAYVRAI